MISGAAIGGMMGAAIRAAAVIFQGAAVGAGADDLQDAAIEGAAPVV